jgi:hypothetical protein
MKSNEYGCTFDIHFEAPLDPGYPKDLRVELTICNSLKSSKLEAKTRAAIYNLANSQLDGLAPKVLEYGFGIPTAKVDGELDYVVMEFITEATCLDTFWEDHHQDNQRELVDSIARVVEKLQKLDPQTLIESLAGTYFVSPE